MNLWTLIRRSLRFHARAHLGVVLGAAIGSAALVGALVVGDSVHESLRQGAIRRVQNIDYALMSGDRFFLRDLGQRVGLRESQATALLLSGTAARQDGTARANRVHVVGVDTASWPQFARWHSALRSDVLEQWRARQTVFINEALATQLKIKPGDELLLRIRKPSALAQDAVITPRNDTSLALRLPVGVILPATLLGDFDPAANQIPAANAFLPLDFLGPKLELAGRANLLVLGSGTGDSGPENLRKAWSLEDAQLKLQILEWTNRPPGENLTPVIELASSRVFLDSPTIAAALAPNRSQTNTIRVLTYLANLIQNGERGTPYSMVTASDGAWVPADMRDDEILVNDWLADDLQLKPGDDLALSYYVVDSAARLVEHTNHFKVHAVVPMRGIYADRTLMPDFPGVAKAESTHDWDTGFPLVHKIREKDEAYWKSFRGTPKAFVTLRAGQTMWANRFGSLTAIRYPSSPQSPATVQRDKLTRELLANLNPTQLGFQFEPIRQRALQAADQSQDFGQLFLGFSLFLVVAALLLMALLFQLGLEQRSAETGTLLALGFRPAQVRRMLLLEGVVLAVLGGLLGVVAGLGYAKAMLWGLTTVWRSAVGNFALAFHVTTQTLVIGILASSFVAVLTIGFTLRKQARRPAYELLTGAESGLHTAKKSRAIWLAIPALLGVLALLAWVLTSGQTENAGAFFGAGTLLLIAGLAFASNRLASFAAKRHPTKITTATLSVGGCARRPKRSLATIGLLASGCFVILSIGVFRLDANRNAWAHSSGTGGFALVGESSLPVIQDLNGQSGREFFGLNPQQLTDVHVISFRVHEGDDASCLNLNRAQKPRLLGVKPESLAGRFTFASAAKGQDVKSGWELLKATPAGTTNAPVQSDEVPAVGDANSIEWALGKKLGETIEYTDEKGRTFKLRLVGAVANSILQGSLIIDEAQFLQRFPNESGYRFFLIDAPSNAVAQVSATFSRALQDVGLELTPTVERMAAFNAVQNTYIGTFQVLGGLGLLLGSAGLGVVVLRNVLERRGELALLLAVGFRRRAVKGLVLSEHCALLGAGLALGLVTAFVAVLPSLLSPVARLPYASLGLTVAAVVLNGMVWTWIATGFALRGNLLQALRNE